MDFGGDLGEDDGSATDEKVKQVSHWIIILDMCEFFLQFYKSLNNSSQTSTESHEKPLPGFYTLIRSSYPC